MEERWHRTNFVGDPSGIQYLTNTPMLYLRLPALEYLHTAWSKCLIYNARYNAFQGPLAASVAKIAKIAKYYSRQQNCLDVWEFWIVH